MNKLSEKAQKAKQLYEEILQEVFLGLSAVDPEVHKEALFVWDDKLDAAVFMSTSHPLLDGRSPIEAVENGARADVLLILSNIKDGNFS